MGEIKRKSKMHALVHRSKGISSANFVVEQCKFGYQYASMRFDEIRTPAGKKKKNQKSVPTKMSNVSSILNITMSNTF